MDVVWIPLISALLGAVIGSTASIAGVVVQTRAERRRDRTRLIVEAAIADFQHSTQLATQSGKYATLYPLVTFFHYHSQVLSLIDQDNLNEETLDEVNRERDKFLAVVAKGGD